MCRVTCDVISIVCIFIYLTFGSIFESIYESLGKLSFPLKYEKAMAYLAMLLLLYNNHVDAWLITW